ncbi:hypothetical protein B0H11DRAFT_1969596 [Mycena galericulata]|nr:hypothetical protein B0H11DRAFT_1969596 [Mycena galericulata]
MNFDLKAAGCSLDSFDAGTVNLIVEGKEYKVNRFFLNRDSPVLREMFSSPVDTTEPAWTLSGVTKEELEHLLWIYYNPSIEHYWAPTAVWRDILKLADMWQMTGIKYIALNHLSRAKFDPIEKIKLCERDDVGRYQAREAYIQVCTREEPLTSTEFQALGMDPVLRIMQIRERILANRHSREGQETLSEEDIVDDTIGRWPPSQPSRAPVDDGTWC